MTQISAAVKRHNNTPMWIFGLLVLAILMTPTTLWIKDSSISVADTRQGEDIEIEYDGQVVRDFVGRYGVIIRDVSSNQIVCEARGGPFPYVVGSTRPDPLTMAWWAVSDTRCYGENLPTGLYSMNTCWSIYPTFRGWVSPISRTHCIEPVEPFHIYPDD